jgi:hypothetical protein
MRRTGRLRFFLRDILCWCLLSFMPFSTASVSACWSILITLFPSFLSLSLSLLLFLAAGLKRGLNFSVAPSKAPKFEIIKSIETAAVRLAPEKAEAYRAKIKSAIEKCKKLKFNLTKTEESAIHGLSKDKNIKIIKADKGNVTVLMNSKEYDDKLQKLVNTDDHRQLPRDPTIQIEAKVHKELKRWKEDVGTSLKKLAPRKSIPPHLYGLTKVHKDGYPLRIIVSGFGSPCRNLARFLFNIISPLARKSERHINKSMDFIEQISQIKMEKGDEMVSFDVVSFFYQCAQK